MNEVDRQVAELQAQVGNKAKKEYFVEVESEDIASQTEENEIEIPQERKTFEVEVDETQGDPVVEDKSKQEEVKTKRNLKKIPKINIVSLFRKDLMNMLINLVNLDDVKRKQYKLLKLLRPKETKFKKN
jgi:hypothetical protein